MLREAGKYIQQIEGYKAFVPFDLPPIPNIDFDDELTTLLSKADRALGRLDGSIQVLPNPELFVFMYALKEAVLSSQIEGTQASLGDVLEVEAKLYDPNRPEGSDESLNYVSALNFGLDRLRELPLSLRLIREIHARLMQGVRGQFAAPGEFRTTQNWIGPQGAPLKDASFVPPPPHALPNLLGAFETYLHAQNQTPLLIKLGLLHAHFETLHPFLDGNGRMGRLLITFCLCQQEVLIRPVLYLSHYLKKHRSTYYDRLQAIRTDGRWEEWLKFFLTGIFEVSNAATETSRKIVDLRERHRQALIDNLGRGAANGLKLLESLYQKPIFTVSTVTDFLSISPQAANNLTDRIESLGLVEEITGNKRNRVFRYQSYVDLFA